MQITRVDHSCCSGSQAEFVLGSDESKSKKNSLDGTFIVSLLNTTVCQMDKSVCVGNFKNDILFNHVKCGHSNGYVMLIG